MHNALGMPRDTISGFFYIVPKPIDRRETGKEAANVNGSHPRFYERDLTPLFQPLSALSLKETNLSGYIVSENVRKTFKLCPCA